ncbi:ParB/RepB/Spo0J family partition protein [Streptomyces pseudovenezuelae]|uniref:ParB/RepB/Spo0J family partition protein n=1 Tax=Streptomyces pseudovenezuelae TaxID=67350 RepID=UPI0036E7AAB8
MSKADTIGPAPSFGAVRSARRRAISAIGGEDSATALTELPVTQISENPDNPRNHLRNLDETVESIREVGIILPIVVATVDAYLRDRPDRAGDLDDGAQYVVIDGHRRLEASRRVGLATIPVRVDNARVATDESLLEAAFVANYHRDDMTDLEEAHALKQLVDYYGSQTKAAKRLGIPQGTISSKMSLLKLAPELQKDLMTGARTVEHVRNLGKLTPEEQKAKADERAQEARRKAEAPAEPPARQSSPADYHGVIIPESAPVPPAAAARPVQAAAETVPEPRRNEQADSPTAATAAPAVAQEAGTAKPPKPFPYDDPSTAVLLWHQKMRHDDFVAAVRMGLTVLREQHPDDFKTILDEVTGQ